MASEGGANRPPPPPLPKRQAPADQQPADVVTYKRRRTANADAKVATPSPGPGATYVNTVARSGNSPQGGHQRLARHWITWRDTLEGFLESPSVNQGGGIQSCIRDALRYNLCQPVQQCNVGKGQGAPEEHPSGVVDAKEIVASVALKDATAASLGANKAMCNNALLDILVSEKFALLCDLLVGTFHVNKPDKVINLEKIDAKMRNGDYAQNLALFDDDIQQVWEKFEQVGREMTGLASNISIISRASYQKQASGVEVAEHRTGETSLFGVIHKVPKNSTTTMQLVPCDSSHSTIPKRTETPGLYRIRTCKKCGTKAEEEKRLICDECDTMYHFQCAKQLDPSMKEVPTIWNCSACSNKEKESAVSLHDDCDVCEKLDIVKPVEHPEAASIVKPVEHPEVASISKPVEHIEVASIVKPVEHPEVASIIKPVEHPEVASIVKPVEHPEVASGTELAGEIEGSSVSSMEEDNEPDLSTTALSNLCKHCGTCEDDDKKFLVCGHPYCPYKFYHIRCLKTSQIASEQQKNLECWYCPSCVCRGCFKDKDDEETVLCDGCDDAYHLYCMKPLRTSVPKGQWYCPLCSVQKAREGLQKYEHSILKRHKKVKRVSEANQSNALPGDGPEKNIAEYLSGSASELLLGQA